MQGAINKVHNLKPCWAWIVTLFSKSLSCKLQSLPGPEILHRAWNIHKIELYQIYLTISPLNNLSGMVYHKWFKIGHVFVLLHENLVDFLQIKYTSNLLCITTTYSENPEGGSSQERWILWVFKNLLIFKRAKNSKFLLSSGPAFPGPYVATQSQLFCCIRTYAKVIRRHLCKGRATWGERAKW